VVVMQADWKQYMLVFGGTVNVVPWVYGPEILPLEARTRGTAISVSSHWMWNFFIVMICKFRGAEKRNASAEADQIVAPVLINRIGFHTYILFAILLACFVPIVYFFCKFSVDFPRKIHVLTTQ
jgi:hypothetical protein